MRRLSVVLACLMVGSAAQAHVGHDLAFSAPTGFAHPFSGGDHIAAMICVGLWAARAGGKRTWVWPLAFVTAMLAGGLIGHAGIPLPAVEPAIALSVVALGLVVAAGVVAPLPVGVMLVALFAVFHGHAHGAEAPATGWLGYAAGFALATAILHLVGIGLGIGLQQMAGRTPVRVLGTAAALFGVFLLVQ
jgi:urease accessory protein